MELAPCINSFGFELIQAVGVAQRSQLTPCDRFCQVEQVASEKIEVAEAKRR